MSQKVIAEVCDSCDDVSVDVRDGHGQIELRWIRHARALPAWQLRDPNQRGYRRYHTKAYLEERVDHFR